MRFAILLLLAPLFAHAADPGPPPDAMSVLDLRQERMEGDESAMMARLPGGTVDVGQEEQERLRQLAAESGK